jgi:feruloyl esterase
MIGNGIVAVPRRLIALCALWIGLAGGLVRAATCESLAQIHLANTAVTSARTVAAGSFTPPKAEGAPPGGPTYKTLPAFCQVTGVIKPTSDSDIRFEVWMPATGWNGRFQGIGNGGFAGSINYSGLADAVADGYAAASTDTGHTQSGINAQWALDHPEKVADFGYRAIHTTTENGKAIVREFYGEAPKYSYFNSCSNGGRQALMEAQRFPADYDGIIAGAPANNWTHLFAGFIWNAQALSEPGGYIPPAKFTAIETGALTACDTLDGVQDGVIDDPRKCHFDPATLLCLGEDSVSCLTAPQVNTLKRIYSGPKDSKGEQLFPGFPPGGAAGLLGWTGWITGMSPEKSAQFAFGTQFYANMVFDNASWDYHTFNFDKDLKLADGKAGKVLNAADPNLKTFMDRKGKLILYHGWSDAAIPAPSTIRYYENVEAKMGSRQSDSFVRLFLVPGMQHCAGGPGPNSFGQVPGAQHDADHDIEKAMEHWVEDGVAPEKIVATKYKYDTNPASGVVRTRPLCAYPLAARYKGTGSTDDAANFTCTK